MTNSASAEGTTKYKERFPNFAKGHFRQAEGLWLSSLGIGTYLGDWDDETDKNYIEAITRFVELGGNVIDTAANYRFQRSERSIGQALLKIKEKGFSRDELFISTKAGFLPFELEPPRSVTRYFEENFVKKGIAEFTDLIGKSHCMTPDYLQNQIEQSLRNMGLEVIDLFYIHNPETQLEEIERPVFEERLAQAFERLEEIRQKGQIKFYGLATWEGFRTISKKKMYLSLERVVEIARQVGGENNGFKFIQQPFSMAMIEAMLMTNQPYKTKKLPMCFAAQALGINVMTSSPLLQGRLINDKSESFRATMGNVELGAQVSLQFVRSALITSAMVGMSQVKHVEENMGLTKFDIVPEDDYLDIFKGEG